MATIASNSLSSMADRRDGRSSPLAGIRGFCGPGPAWRAKHKAVSPGVQSMLVEIRAAKAKPPAR